MSLGVVLELVAYVCALYFAGLFAERLSCPALVGEILIGMALGPHGGKLLRDDVASALSIAGQIGLLLMVCEGGLSMDLSVLKAQGVRATILALTGTILPVVLGAPFMMILGYDWMASLASGTALSSTAIGFTLRLMSDLGLMETAQGQLITAAAMLDDVFSLVLLAMLRVLVDVSVSDVETGQSNVSTPALPPAPPATPPAPPPLPVAWLVTRPLLASLGVFIASLGLGVSVLRLDAALVRAASSSATAASSTTTTSSIVVVDATKAEKAAKEEEGKPSGVQRSTRSARLASWLLSSDVTLAAVLGLGIVGAWASDAVYSSSLLGAFLAGTLFCSFERARGSWTAVAPVQAWLTRAFFGATVAFTVPLDALLDGASFGDGLFLLLAAILGKFLSGAWAAPLRPPSGEGAMGGRRYWCAFLQVGCAMIGRGELGFVLAKEALEAGLMPSRAYCATVWALLLATLLGPYAFRLSLRCTPKEGSS